MQNLSYRENKQTAKLRSHISLLALVKDADGQVAAKVSRDLANDIPADKFDAFTRGDLTFAATAAAGARPIYAGDRRSRPGKWRGQREAGGRWWCPISRA